MRLLLTRRRLLLFVFVALIAGAAAWIYGNQATRADLATYAPADCLAFVESDDLAGLVFGIEQTEAWRSLSAPLGAPPNLLPNRWLIRLARWTGIGSTDTILFARSQVAVVFSGAEASQAESTLTIKPLATLIIETHTTQVRMKSTVERHLEELARRVYKNPALLRKQVDGIDLEEWISDDKTHQIVIAFINSTVIIGNDESSVLHSIEARNGKRAALRDAKDFFSSSNDDRANATLSAFISQAGVKSLLQAFAIYRGGSSADAITSARIFADTFGGVVKNIKWSARFVDGMVEDRCLVTLPDGVADKLRASMVPERGVDLAKLQFIPSDTYSFSSYQLRDAAGFWTDLNAAVSSHTDLIGSVAARPMLRGLLKPYGIEDPDAFCRAIGPHVQTIRLDENSPSVMVVEAFDRPALRNVVMKRLGNNVRTEPAGDAEILVAPDNFAAAFTGNFALLGPAEGVRRCLAANSSALSITSRENFRRAGKLMDVSLPLTVVTFASDQQAAVSFVETFSPHERPAFATNAAAIEKIVSDLPYAVSVTMLKGSAVEWTSRSSFGLAGALVAQIAPEKPK
jgi:hypothetical protein